jgi:hypothetical protein
MPEAPKNGAYRTQSGTFTRSTLEIDIKGS